MTSSSTPLGASIANVDAMVTLFGRFDLHDAELGGLHLGIAPDGAAQLDAEFVLPGEFALGGAPVDRGIDYRVTIRCVDIGDLTLADFQEQNTVAEYAFEIADADDERVVRVAITCSPGCDLELRCRRVSVVSVQPIAL